jgi:antitoxin MazE
LFETLYALIGYVRDCGGLTGNRRIYPEPDRGEKQLLRVMDMFAASETGLTCFILVAILRIFTGGVNMVTKIQRWGNSQGLRLAKQVLEDAHISVGDDVDVTTRDGLIVIAPARRVRGKRSLQELVSQIPKGYKAEETDWGEPVGQEAW